MIPAEHRLRTLMSDPVYRLGVAWQNTGYNQPPHTSYYLGEGMAAPAAPRLALTTPETPGERVPGPATAAPGRMVLRGVDPDGDGTYTVSADLWWGQNGHTVTLLEDGVPVATRDLVDVTPKAQHAAFVASGKANGTYEYTVVLTNQHGSTTSKALTVKVKRADPDEAAPR